MDYDEARFRDLAKQCRVIAQGTTHQQTRDAILTMAEEFEAEAERLKASTESK